MLYLVFCICAVHLYLYLYLHLYLYLYCYLYLCFCILRTWAKWGGWVQLMMINVKIEEQPATAICHFVSKTSSAPMQHSTLKQSRFRIIADFEKYFCKMCEMWNIVRVPLCETLNEETKERVQDIGYIGYIYSIYSIYSTKVEDTMPKIWWKY